MSGNELRSKRLPAIRLLSWLERTPDKGEVDCSKSVCAHFIPRSGNDSLMCSG